MDLTTMFSQIWGPILLAIGVGIFMSRSHYLSVYRELSREPFAAFIFGVFALALGLAHIGMHNLWNSLQEFVLSMLGWGLMLKGLAFVVFPRLVGRAGMWVSDTTTVSTIAVGLLIVGGYLTYVGYF